MKIKTIIHGVTAITAFLIITSFRSANFQEPWKAPEWTDGLKTPFRRATPEIISEGEKLYITNCVACHGKTGLGDGVLGMEFTPKPANFHSDIVRNQKDGAIFWKLAEGRGAMPSYKAALTDEQRWKLIAYIRQLSPQSTTPPKPRNL